MRCLEFMKIVEILRLKEMKIFTYRDIADSVGCSKTTVGDILSRCKECCLTYEDAQTITPNNSVTSESLIIRSEGVPAFDSIFSTLFSRATSIKRSASIPRSVKK